jgi:hypothetical protein
MTCIADSAQLKFEFTNSTEIKSGQDLLHGVGLSWVILLFRIILLARAGILIRLDCKYHKSEFLGY